MVVLAVDGDYKLAIPRCAFVYLILLHLLHCRNVRVPGVPVRLPAVLPRRECLLRQVERSHHLHTICAERACFSSGVFDFKKVETIHADLSCTWHALAPSVAARSRNAYRRMCQESQTCSVCNVASPSAAHLLRAVLIVSVGSRVALGQPAELVLPPLLALRLLVTVGEYVPQARFADHLLSDNGPLRCDVHVFQVAVPAEALMSSRLSDSITQYVHPKLIMRHDMRAP